jgi:hypothetical protein
MDPPISPTPTIATVSRRSKIRPSLATFRPRPLSVFTLFFILLGLGF